MLWREIHWYKYFCLSINKSEHKGSTCIAAAVSSVVQDFLHRESICNADVCLCSLYECLVNLTVVSYKQIFSLFCFCTGFKAGTDRYMNQYQYLAMHVPCPNKTQWLVGFCLTSFHSILQSSKVLAKKELSYMPIIGWMWYFLEIVFCKRKWEEDRKTVMQKLLNLRDYPENFWVSDD